MKVALLIGVSESGYGLPPLPTAINDILALRRVLERSDRGGFDQVKTLINPNPPVMREAIQNLVADRAENDLVLLFFCGYGVKDEIGQLYFSTGITATRITSTNPQGELVKATALPASFVSDILSNSYCQNQIAIFNWQFSSALPQGLTVNDQDITEIKNQLGGEGWVMLTSCTPIPNSWEQENSELSIYTGYLVEGIETGAAEQDGDGWISIEELNEYVNRKFKQSAPAWQTQFYSSTKKRKLLLILAPTNESKLKYRKEVERWVTFGDISPVVRYNLDRLARTLQLPPEDCTTIEAEVLKPYQEYEEKLQSYGRAFNKALESGYPLSNIASNELRHLQQSLGLRFEDIAPIEKRLTRRLASNSLAQESDHQSIPANPASAQDISRRAVPKIASSIPAELSPDKQNQVQPSNTVNHQEPGLGTNSLVPLSTHNSSLPKDAEQSTVSAQVTDENESAIANPPVTPSTTNLKAEENDHRLTPLAEDNQFNLSPSTTQPAPELYIQTPSLPSANQSSNLRAALSIVGAENHARSNSSFPNKFLLLIGIGGGLAALGLGINLASRLLITPGTNSSNTISSSPTPAPISDPKNTDSQGKSKPSKPESSQPKICQVFVKGNLRSEPASFRENIIQFVQEKLLVTGKQTPGGWVEVKLPDGGLAWAHRDVIDNDAKMDDCLLEKQIKIKMVEDIIPPNPQTPE